MARQIRKQVRKTRTASLTALMAILALLVFSATPAFAHHKSDHSQGGGNSSSASDHDGDADSDSNTSYTEDNDTNDGTANNVSDDGDNAHPSGKDRSVENGNSGNQGKSESNPDDSKGPQRYEGARGDDKPNGPGGTDLADQDGNNGCGNDDDFNDDNNGWCGKKKEKAPEVVAPTAETKVCPAGTDKAGQAMDDLKNCNEDEVKGRVDVAKPKVKVPTTVLDKKIRRAAPVVRNARVAAGAPLPFTGGSVMHIAAAALGLIALGTLTLSMSTRTNEN